MAAISGHWLAPSSTGTKNSPTTPARPIVRFCHTIIDRSVSVGDIQRTQVIDAA